MRKILYTFSTAALMLGGLTACNTDEGASTYNTDNARPIGYYSNENDRDRTDRNGNVRDNDGPLTEIMDRTGAENNNRNNRTGVMNDNRKNKDNRANYKMNPNNENRSGIMNYRDEQRKNGIMNHRGNNRGTKILNNHDNNNRGVNPFNDGNPNTNRDNGHGYSDQNYHSHLNDNNHRVHSYGYYNNDDQNIVAKIKERASKVKNVDETRVIVTDENILVAVDTNDNNNQNVKDAVKKAVEPLAKGKNVNVVTDEGTFTRVRDIDNDIRNGNRRESIDADINDLFDNIGDTIRAPFTNENRG
ncbi:YhcN/YlaJ family sporulation lipoprotein [Ferdinandcohnia sp. Marseille-Q9671]